MWKCDGRANFSGDGETVVADRGVWVDDQGDRVRAIVWAGVGKLGVEDKNAAAEDRCVGRVGGFQGARVHVLRGRDLHGEPQLPKRPQLH